MLLGNIEVGEDRVHRARLDAGVAVDADLGIDVELLSGLEVRRPRPRMDAIHRADLDARVVLDAAAGDDVGHCQQATNLRSTCPLPDSNRQGVAMTDCLRLLTFNVLTMGSASGQER